MSWSRSRHEHCGSHIGWQRSPERSRSTPNAPRQHIPHLGYTPQILYTASLAPTRNSATAWHLEHFDNHPQPYMDHEGAMPRYQGTAPRRTGCVGTRYGSEQTFRDTCAYCDPLHVWAQVKLQFLATHYLSAGPSSPQLYRPPPTHGGLSPASRAGT